MLRILSNRYGFACNSSSTHSCVVVKDQEVDDDYNEGDFGWDCFTLSSKEAQQEYFVTMLATQIRALLFETFCNYGIYDQKEFVADRIDQLVWGQLPYWAKRYYIKGGYVDHQSHLHFPCRGLAPYPDMDFAKDFIQAATDTEGLVILGGNDNDEESHPLLDHPEPDNDFGKVYNFLLQDQRSTDNTIRVVKHPDYYVLFNRLTGHKLRVSFAQEAKPYSDSPELVDLKITNYCDIGCKYCYQSSTEEGQHADFYTIQRIVDKLQDCQTLEIAIGGGEPTYHPKFVEILQYIRKKGIIPNFTTRSLKWLEGPLAPVILAEAGAFAFSVNSLSQLQKAFEAYAPHLRRKDYGQKVAKMQAQVVVGTTTKKSLLEIIEFVNRGLAFDRDYNRVFHGIQLTLLGYKPVGFGKDYKPANYAWLEEVLFKQNLTRFYIDSALVKELEPLLIKHKVDPRYYSVQEGTHSCYIDACTEKLYKDSYSTDEGLSIWTDADRHGYKRLQDLDSTFQAMQTKHGIRPS